METQLLLPSPDPTTATAIKAAGTPPVETDLPKSHHEAYRMKLAGKAMQEIADSFGCDRTTIWRWCKAVESEALKQLADRPVFNIIVEECNRLTDLEEQAREGAESTKSDRAKSMYLAEARRAAVARQNLLLSVGILPRAPQEVFRITANMKPSEQREPDPAELLTREEAVEKLIEQFRRASRLS